MSEIENAKKSAMARLRSASGHISAEIPDVIRVDGVDLKPKEIVAREKSGDLREEERQNIIELLNRAVSDAERSISQSSSVEEIRSALESGLGSRRVLHIIRGSRRSQGELNDAKRWMEYTKKIR